MKFVPLLLASLTALVACGERTTTTPRSTQRPIAVQQRSIQASTPSRDVLHDCNEILLDQSSEAGRFRVGLCPVKEGAELRFVHQRLNKAKAGVYALSLTAADAIVESEARLWGGHVVSVDLAQERGGELVLGNWRGGAFVISNIPYAAGDEEPLGLTYRDAAFYVSTESKGEQRLVEVESGPERGTFLVEKTSCRWDPGSGMTQVLELTLNTHGRLTNLAYLGLTPQQGGTSTSCSLDADRDDGATLWTDDGKDTLIDLEADGGQGGLNRVRIGLEGGRYKVDFELTPSSLCGQSSVHARSITLDPKTPVCQAVVLAD